MKNLTAINSDNSNAYPERYRHGYEIFNTVRGVRLTAPATSRGS